MKDDAGAYYMCCGCHATLPLTGVEPAEAAARAQARAAGWWAWRDNKDRGKVYCPQHLGLAPKEQAAEGTR